MIYVVTTQQELFEAKEYRIISQERSIEMLRSWGNMIQFDTETTDIDPHIGKLLTMQFGDIEGYDQILVDCTTINPILYKEILENKFLIGQNLKFDLKWLFNYGIVPTKLWDTMIVEQLLYLGFPHFMIGASREIINSYADWYEENSWRVENLRPDQKREVLFQELPKVADFIYNHSGVSLKSLAYRYLNEDMDKTVRGQIIYRGLDLAVITYACNDVKLLYKIMRKQQEKLKLIGALKAAKVECDFVPCVAYYEWCGVMLDVPLWQEKMKQDYQKLESAYNALNDFVVATGDERFFDRNIQLDLFADPNEEPKPKCLINWQSTKQVIPFLTLLGFDCRGIDKKTKEEKDTIDAKVLAPQKGINDEFLKVYFEYTEAYKVCSTYGQAYINAINPNTGRIHTEFRQLGTDTGRLACGSQDINKGLAALKKLPLQKGQKAKTGGIKTIQNSTVCSYPQLQNLPNDELTRKCFRAQDGNKLISIDYSGEELANLSIHKFMYNNAHVFLKRKYEKWLAFYESRRAYSLNSGNEMAI